jgi:hypothetical protein
VVLGSTVGNASLGGSSGRLLSPPLRTNNGTLLVSAPLNFVRIYSLAGVLLYEQLGGTTDALGQINVVTSAVQAGVSIRVDWETAAGQRRMPVTVTV